MSFCNVRPSTFSFAARPAAGCWKMAPGRALSLWPRQRGVLEIARGRAWVTVSLRHPPRGAPGVDQVLRAGDRLAVGPGQQVVVEGWSPPGCTDPVAFDWHPAALTAATASPQADLPRVSHSTGAASTATDWQCGVVQPLHDLASALGQGGRAVVVAGGCGLDAAGRLAVGLGRYALHRVVTPIRCRPG